jgi:site-specific DNA recombinase
VADALPAAIYCRISRDAEKDGLGVGRQEKDCRALAERLGWDVVAVFVDNDVSAFSGKVRPQYRAMLDAARSGQVRGVIAWHTDRLHRRVTELEEFVNVAETHQLQIETVTAGTVDLSTPSGRMMARTLGNMAQYEVEQTRKRVRSKKQEAAEQGKYRGGPRPYGFERDGVTINEPEAEIVREMTRAVLAGRTLSALARELNDRGVPTSTGNVWNHQRLRDVLIRPRNAGMLATGRADRGQAVIVKREAWPAIVDEDTWNALYALLTDPSRRKQDGNTPRWLGAGLYTCSKCGSVMRAAPHGGTEQRKYTRRYLYRCTGSAHLTISADNTDEYVRGVVAEMVRDPRVVAAMSPHVAGDLASDREARVRLVARLDAFEADYAAGRITGTQLQKATAAVSAELDEVNARLAESIRRSTSSPILNAHDPGQAFLDAPLDVQRAVLTALLVVEVLPSPYRGSAWSSERVRLTPVGA